ncbi:MAG TPA: hypothetical protein VGK81_10290, partial [Anaerolineae bacterium]
MKSKLPAIVITLIVAAFAVWFVLPATGQQLEAITGEQGRPSQLRALWNLLLNATRPPLDLAPQAQISYAKDLSPY